MLTVTVKLGSSRFRGFPSRTKRLLAVFNKVVGGWRVGMTLENNVGMDCCTLQLLGNGFVPWPVCRGRARRPRGLPQLQGTAGLTLVVGGGSSVSWS